MGCTLHPRLNVQTISNTLTCALSQFYDWSIRRNVSMIDSWLSPPAGGGGGATSSVAGCQYCASWCRCHGEAGIRLQSPSSYPTNPLPYPGSYGASRARQATSCAGEPRGGWPAQMSFDLLFNGTCYQLMLNLQWCT